MRITGGVARSIPLKTLDLPELRPATDQMRQALFNSIAATVGSLEGMRPPSPLHAAVPQEGATARLRPWEGMPETVCFLRGLRFVDLFAGSGAYGLEALSRGAAAGVFVERNAKLCAVIRENLAKVCKSAGAQEAAFAVRQGDALAVGLETAAFDLVFCDPPYAMIGEWEKKIFAQAQGGLKVGGLLLFEHPAKTTLAAPEGFELVKTLGGSGKDSPNVGVFKKL